MPNSTTIQAQPGYFVVGFNVKEDFTPGELTFTPIIAWSVGAAPDLVAEAVIPPGAYWEEHHGIGYPDGRIVVDEQTFSAGTPPGEVVAALVVYGEKQRKLGAFHAKLKTV
jgi:hypothetical protein